MSSMIFFFVFLSTECIYIITFTLVAIVAHFAVVLSFLPFLGKKSILFKL